MESNKRMVNINIPPTDGLYGPAQCYYCERLPCKIAGEQLTVCDCGRNLCEKHSQDHQKHCLPAILVRIKESVAKIEFNAYEAIENPRSSKEDLKKWIRNTK